MLWARPRRHVTLVQHFMEVLSLAENGLEPTLDAQFQ